jgi:hypothetical protein
MPFVIEHRGAMRVVEHLLSLALQNIPTSSKQSTLPHLHDA